MIVLFCNINVISAFVGCPQDWWWKSRLGKCYYQLGMLRDAEKQFLSALKTSDMVTTVLELSKVGFGAPVMQFVHMPLPLIDLVAGLLACLMVGVRPKAVERNLVLVVSFRGEVVGSGIYTFGSATDSVAAVHSGSRTAAWPDRAGTRASKGA